MSKPRSRFFLSAFLASLLAILAASPIFAQVAIPAAAIKSDQHLQAIFQEGDTLEREERWGEALTHYEDALRKNPGQADIQQRLTIARIHFDVGRRYNDSSFTSALDRIQERKALDLYSEVLLKIQAHYVHSPNWQDLLRRGTTQLDIAMTDSYFHQKNLTRVDPHRVTAFRRNLHRVMDTRGARSRHELRSQVSVAARYVSQQLGIPPQVTITEYMCGALGALDMYSSYLTAAQLDDVMSQIEGNFVGLGIELKSDQQSLLIVNVIPGGPAYQGGIRPNDRIIEVDGRTMDDVSTSAAADLLKGVEGSVVKVTVVSPDNTTRRLQLRRTTVEVPSIEDEKIIDKDFGVAYMKLTSFQKTTLRDFDAALWSLHRQGMRSLIVDVRGNPGGLLTASVEVADKFVSSGTIVSTRGRSPREDFDYKAHNGGTWRVPLIVLIDGDSASASEIFAGAIHDHRRGTVVGQRSYGKGSVQGIFPLNSVKSGVRLTTAKFYSPSGQPISRRGVQPDVEVRVVAKPNSNTGEIDESADTILNAALQVARQQLTKR